MKITFVISYITAGGGERVLCALANYLAAHDYNVSIITFANPTQKPFYDLDSRIELFQLGKTETPCSSIFTRLNRLWNRLISLRKTIKAIEPHVIISFLTETNISTLGAAYGLGIPVIVSERTDPYAHKLPWWVLPLRKITYATARYVVVQTTMAQKYFSYLGNKTKIILNPLPQPSKIKSSADVLKKPKTIISVGRLCPNKGFQDLILAFHTLEKKDETLRLTIYGEGSYRPDLEKLINSLSLEKKVFLPGAVPKIEEKLLQADIFVFPSYYEGFPNALCEALATGLPVIASDCGGNKEIIKDGVNGLLFPVKDHAKLAETLENLLHNSPLRKKLNLQGPLITKQLTMDKIATQWIELFP